MTTSYFLKYIKKPNDSIISVLFKQLLFYPMLSYVLASFGFVFLFAWLFTTVAPYNGFTMAALSILLVVFVIFSIIWPQAANDDSDGKFGIRFFLEYKSVNRTLQFRNIEHLNSIVKNMAKDKIDDGISLDALIETIEYNTKVAFNEHDNLTAYQRCWIFSRIVDKHLNID